MQPATQSVPNSIPMVVEAEIGERSGTILVVEDEPLVRESTCEILQAAGYRVLSASNAAEAKATFQGYERVVQLLLTDVVLPGRNGCELAEELRGINPGLRTIFISGYPENTVTQHGLHEAGKFYLPKPFSTESLTRKVRHAMAQVVKKTQGRCSTFSTPLTARNCQRRRRVSAI